MTDAFTLETHFVHSVYDRLQRFDEDEGLEEECLRLEASFLDFVEAAWPQIDSSRLVIGWHIEALSLHLEAITFGEIRKFIVNLPPRCGKTLISMALWPAWTWIQRERSATSGPQVRFLCGSYNEKLALQSSMLCRRLLESEWFERRWGHRVSIRSDQNTKGQFDLIGGGSRIATSVGGTLVGLGGDIVAADDPHNTEEVESEPERQRAIDWWKELSTTRVNDPQRGAVMLVMQRLHESDVTGHVLDSDDAPEFTHLNIPMLYDPRRHCRTTMYDPERGEHVLLWEDPRTQEDELMDPVRYTPASVETMRRNLGPYMFAGRFQQEPTPKAGGIIERGWWRLWPDDAERAAGIAFTYRCFKCGWEALRYNVGASMLCDACDGMAERRLEYPPISYSLLSVDTAYGEREENSWSAATTWGIWHDENEAPRVMLLEAWRGRPKLRGDPERHTKGLVDICFELGTRQGRIVDCMLIEKKSRGVDLYNELERLTRDFPFRLEYFEPTGRGDKSTRLHAVQGLFTNERVWAPNKQWADMVISEVTTAPKGQFNDLADTVAQGLLHLRDSGLLSMQEEFVRDKRQRQMYRGNRQSVADEFEGVSR